MERGVVRGCAAAVRTPPRLVTSASSRVSIVIARPVAAPGSTVERGATTKNGTEPAFAASANPSVPTSFAVSRSPRSGPPRRPRRRRDLRGSPTVRRSRRTPGRAGHTAAPPHAVRRAPCRSGRVSLTRSSRSRPSFGERGDRTEGGAAPRHRQRARVAQGQDGQRARPARPDQGVGRATGEPGALVGQLPVDSERLGQHSFRAGGVARRTPPDTRLECRRGRSCRREPDHTRRADRSRGRRPPTPSRRHRQARRPPRAPRTARVRIAVSTSSVDTSLRYRSRCGSAV